MTRILQLSDCHIVPKRTKAYGLVDTETALVHAVEAINRRLPSIGPVALVAVTGDLTDFGTAEEYALFQSIMADLAVPYQAIPGNHDTREAMRAAFAHAPWMPAAGPINWRVDLPDFSLLAFDTSVAGAPHGAVEDATLAWLETALQDLAGRPVILACHHPPCAIGVAPMDRQNLLQPAALAELIRAYPGPTRVISGHVHRHAVVDFAGSVAVTCPGASHAVTLDMRPDPQNSLTMEPSGVLLHDYTGGFRSHLIPLTPSEGPLPFSELVAQQRAQP